MSEIFPINISPLFHGNESTRIFWVKFPEFEPKEETFIVSIIYRVLWLF